MQAANTTLSKPDLRRDAHSASSVGAVLRRDRLIISLCVVLITILAWAYLVQIGRQMSSSLQYDAQMAEMSMAMTKPWTMIDVVFIFTMWTVMMVAMMIPTAAPMLLLFARARAGRGARGVPIAVLAFGAGYATVWVGFSACAALGQAALHQAALLSPMMTASSPQIAGAILIAVGAYQVTPLKRACLAQCRSPLGFLMSHWRDGVIGSFRMGLGHGTYCVGCCWALMGLLFAVGVMNLLWVAAIALFVLYEKIGPGGTIVGRVAGALAMVAGVGTVTGVW
jgi:predicted metal-binding membrane protein